ncbi:hypothetical protein ACJJTC_009532 [Scirpophaga incertulas]
MLRPAVLLCCLYFLVLMPRQSKALSKEKQDAIKAHFEEIGKQCVQDFPLADGDIADIRGKNPAPAGAGVPCFLACMLRKIGLLDSAGMVDKDNSLTLAKTVFEDEEELKSISEFINECSSVNSVAVGDGEKGCERAFLSYKCMIENHSKFGIDL